mgnify:CR=1 FL=1
MGQHQPVAQADCIKLVSRLKTYSFISKATERITNMRAEIAALTQEIKQSLELLRRHL